MAGGVDITISAAVGGAVKDSVGAGGALATGSADAGVGVDSIPGVNPPLPGSAVAELDGACAASAAVIFLGLDGDAVGSEGRAAAADEFAVGASMGAGFAM
jgi:hypothetical protein